MAEFCEKCFKQKLISSDEQKLIESGEIQVFVSDWDDLCEGCGKIVPVVIRVQKR